MQTLIDPALVRLTEAARTGPDKYVSEYFASFDRLLEIFPGGPRSGALRCASAADAVQAIKVGLLFNEVSVVDLFEASSELHITIPGPESEFAKKNPKLQIAVPNEKLPAMAHALQTKRINPGFMLPGGEATDDLLIDASRLIQAGKLLVRPQRLLMYDTGAQTPTGGTNWHVLEAAADAPSDTWKIEGERLSQAEQIVTESAFRHSYSADRVEGVKCEIIVPFIQGVSLTDYASIVEDEGDLLVEFRSAVNELAKTAVQRNVSLTEFIDGTVRPRIAKIGRSFKRISNTTGLKASGASVTTAVMALTSYLTAGTASSILALAGGAGVIATVRELADRRNKLAELKDDPLYLLWRMQVQAHK